MVLRQLDRGETRLLSLVVAVRKSMADTHRVKGDLTEQVKSSLRQLVATHQVIDDDGLYSLARQEGA